VQLSRDTPNPGRSGGPDTPTAGQIRPLEDGNCSIDISRVPEPDQNRHADSVGLSSADVAPRAGWVRSPVGKVRSPCFKESACGKRTLTWVTSSAPAAGAGFAGARSHRLTVERAMSTEVERPKAATSVDEWAVLGSNQ
jgi:hypothetical protein